MTATVAQATNRGIGIRSVLASLFMGSQMVQRYLTFALVAGVVIWLGVLVAAPSPIKSAERDAAAVDCAVICLNTQPITWQPAPPEPIPLTRAPSHWSHPDRI